MDGAAIAGAATGAGGVVVSLFSLYKARRAERDQLGLQQLQLALDTQQEQIDRYVSQQTAQDGKIERQSGRIDEQYRQIRDLRGEVERCEADKRRLTDRVAELERLIPG
jgi:uncharacterized protein HemX